MKIDHNSLMMKKSYILYLLGGFILAVAYERFFSFSNRQFMEDSSNVQDDVLLKDEIITPNGIYWERLENDGKDICQQEFESLYISKDTVYRIRAEANLIGDSIELFRLSSPVIKRKIRDYSSSWVRYEEPHNFKTIYLKRYDRHRCNKNSYKNVENWIAQQQKESDLTRYQNHINDMEDKPLKDTPCYYSYKWKNLFYRKNDSISISMVDPRQEISDIYWNNEYILFKNTKREQSLICIYEPSPQLGINWELLLGTIGDNYIDIGKMNHLVISGAQNN